MKKIAIIVAFAFLLSATAGASTLSPEPGLTLKGGPEVSPIGQS